MREKLKVVGKWGAVPPDAAVTVEKKLDYVAEVSKNARASWFGLIVLMLFCGVTLLDVEDKDFFEYGASTQLPLINVSVPTEHFFWAAPLLVTGLYTYLHLYLDKLWRALSRLDDEIDHRPVTEVVYPWLISDTALEMRKNIDRRPYWFITRIVTFCLCWLIGPVIMVLFWWYSWAPHKEWLTTLIGLQLVWLTSVGVSSWLAMRHRAKSSEPLTIKGLWFVSASVFLLLSWIVISYGWAKTEDGRWWALPGEPNAETAYLYSADLYRANFVKPDKDWQGRDAAWRAYQRKHREDVTEELKRQSESEEKPKEKNVVERLNAQFEEDRGEARAALERRDYRGDDLRNANLREAFLVGADLSESRLDLANLQQARLEGAKLNKASLVRANLTLARLEFADLSAASFEEANLAFSHIAKANFSFAALIDTNLTYIRGIERDQFDETFGDAHTPERFDVMLASGSAWRLAVFDRPWRWYVSRIPAGQRIACWKKWMISRGADRSLLPQTDVKCTTHADSP